jgi:hydroxyacylglutathione hydrolase
MNREKTEPQVISVRLFEDNLSYLLLGPRQKDNRRPAIAIDPGEAQGIFSALKTHEEKTNETIEIEFIFNTHHHGDHIGGNRELVERFHCQIRCSDYDYALHRVDKAAHGFRDGETFEFYGTEIRILAIPGHTLGHIAYYMPAEESLFVGDTLFSLGCGRLFEGTPEQMVSSLKKILALPSSTRLYFGHEYTALNWRFAKSYASPENNNTIQRIEDRWKVTESMWTKNEFAPTPTLNDEAQLNPFLRILTNPDGTEQNHTALAEVRDLLNLPRESDELAVFKKLREIKNGRQ